MKSINKPSNKNFWMVSSNNGEIFYHGETNPDQVTVTGLPNLEFTEDEQTHLSNLVPFADKLPDLPQEGEPVEEGRIYNDNGTPVKAVKDHKRTDKPIEEEMPENWKKGVSS